MRKEVPLEHKHFHLTKYSYIALKNFPKFERNGLAAEIRSTLWQIHDTILQGLREKDKRSKLRKLYLLSDLLVKLGKMIRMSCELKYINLHQYQNWIETSVEMGRMTGGWINANS